MATKSISVLTLAALLLSCAALAQPVQQVMSTDQPADGVYRAVQRGPHERQWQRITQVLDENGFLQTRTNSYVELANGISTWNPDTQEWTDASDEIEILQDGAVARKSQHSVTFAGNLNDPNGTIALRTPDGQQLGARIAGLAYTEVDTGKSIFIAEPKDTQGFVLGRNQVIYLGGFTSINADVRYTTTLSSLEQDIILREQLPSPSDYGSASNQMAYIDSSGTTWNVCSSLL